MRVRTGVVAVVAVATALAGCVTTERTSFKADKGQDLLVRSGRQAILSRKGDTLVVLSPPSRQTMIGERPTYVVAMFNGGRKPQTFLYSGITATYGDKRTPLKVYTVDDLQAEARRQAIAEALILGMVGAAGTAAVARSAGYSSGSGTIAGPSGTASFSYTGFDGAENARATGAAAGATGAAMSRAMAHGEQAVAALETSMLMDNTLLPGEWYGGSFQFERPKDVPNTEAKTYTVTIPVGTVVYRFTIVQEPDKPAS